MKIYFTLCSILLFCTLHAQKDNLAGSLDKSFGNNGTVLTYTLYPIGIDKQQDGSIITAGNIGIKDSIGYFAIKYSPDGAIDTSFGNNGRAFYPDNDGAAICLLVQPDNKILVAGYHAEMFESSYISIVRFNADGTNDLSFGKNGIVISNSTGNINALAVQPDGKIVAEGLDFEKTLTMRFLPNGMPDNTFGINGKVENNFGGSNEGNTVAVQPDGKIVIGGQAGTSLSAFLARYTNSGTLDQSFGNAGSIIYNLGNIATVKDIVLQADGKIVAVGQIANNLNNYNTLIFRSMPDGSLDQNFGNGGFSQQQFTTKSTLLSVVLQKDGKIVSCGSVYDNTKGYTSSFLLDRHTTDGFLDSSFGVNGIEITSLDSTIAAASVFLQGDDEKIIVGGSSDNIYDPTPNAFAIVIARFNNDEQSKKQIIITKIKRWLQHHNGFTWDANSSINSYVVQRSYDGIHFSSLSKINAGTSSNSYADPFPLAGNNYYRLQTTTTEGVVAYSNIIAVTANESTVTISPNPAKNNLQIQGLPSTNKAKLTVVDFTGNQKLQATASSAEYTLNIAPLNSGNYLLKIEMNDEVITRKFVKE